MAEMSITIAPDGTARCLWTEALPLHELGRLDIQRACDIEFDNESQTWCVFNGYGQSLHSHPSRQECLRWEVEHLNQQQERLLTK
jgi:hypothetical protein